MSTPEQQREDALQMTALDGISEDTMEYLRVKRVPDLMEYILRSIILEKPETPREFILELLKNPLPPRIIVSGPPASGKGTQCHKIMAYYKKKNKNRKPVHISSGDILREEVAQGTHLGQIAASFMEQGQLVPDSLIIAVIRKRLEDEDAIMNGWILDGFPRNREQAIALDLEGFYPDSFILLDTPDQVLVERVEGRRTDPLTGMIYHLKFNPPPEDDTALLDRLEERPDDNREVLQPRLDEYHKSVDAILEFYAPIADRVDSNRPDTQVNEDVISCLEKRRIL